MTTKEFLLGTVLEVRGLLSASSKVGIANTLYVPNVEDSGFNLGAGEILKAKTINTCVLFIDIRKSTQLNFAHKEDTLAKLYAAFIKSMLKAAGHFGGKVRNINGDRVMVVFDTTDCFKKAIDTACLMNTISAYIIDKEFLQDKFECGIGIDYGEMLVVKTGTIKQGDENQFYKSFVWLGKPANLASKLTDLANKDNIVIRLKYWYNDILRRMLAGKFPGVTPPSDKPTILEVKLDGNEFAENLNKTSGDDRVKYNLNEVVSWSKSSERASPILITEEVYNGLKLAYGQSEYFTKNIIVASDVKVKGYNGKVYGVNGMFPFN